MSSYRMPASERIKKVTSDCLSVSRLKALMAKIPILTPVNASLAVGALNSLCRLKKQKTLQLAPLSLLKLSRLVTDLELSPMSKCESYEAPSMCSILYYTAVRNDCGAVTEIIDVVV